MQRRLATTALKAFLWIVVPFFCVEILLTVLDPYLFKGFFQSDPDLGFRVRSYFPTADGGRTNLFGFNDRDYPLQKTPGTFRVLVLGDSFCWSGGHDGNYTAILERKLETYHGKHKVDVINAGYYATHTGEQLALLKKFGLQYNPDLVILSFFVGNDFQDGDPNRKRIIVNDAQVDIDRRREHKILGYPIVFPGRLLILMRQRYEAYRESHNAGDGTFSEDTYLTVERFRLDFFNRLAFETGRYQQSIDYILQSVLAMSDLLNSRHIGFVVAIFPDEFQVSPDLFTAILQKFKLKREDYDLGLAQNLLGSFLNSRGIPYIDFLDRFTAEGRKEPLYQLRDSHWNGAGNQLAADILYDDLLKRTANSPQTPGLVKQ